MIPTHREGLAAARRVHAANEAGEVADARDAIVMLSYQLSLTLRLIPEGERMMAALAVARTMVANTRESLD